MKRFYLLSIIIAITYCSLAISQWESCNNGLTFKFVSCFAIKDNFLRAGTSGGVFFSNDYGDNWIQKNNGLKITQINTIAKCDSNIFVGTSYYNDSLESMIGEVFVSSNNGNNWIQNNSELTFEPVNTFALSGNNFFAGTAGYGVYLSNDKGNSWARKDSGLTTNYVLTLAISGNNIIAGTDIGLYLSTNLGNSWKYVNFWNNVISLAAFGNNIFASISNYGIYLSTDNGDKWTLKNNGLNGIDVLSIDILGNNIFVGTAGGGIFLSSDNGNNWIEKNTNLTNFNITSLIIFGNYLYAGTLGSGIFRAKLSDFGITDTPENLRTDNNEFIIFPNPSTDNITISQDKGLQPHVLNCNISIINSLGIEIKKIDEKQLQGKSSINISMEGFPSGMYFCVFNSGTNNISKSFVVLK